MREVKKSTATIPIGVFLLLIIAGISGAVVLWRVSMTTPDPGSDNSQPLASGQPYPAGYQPRIAALLPFAADQLIRLNVRPVAVPLLEDEVPATWNGIEAISIDHASGPNIEQLIAVDPDIIITSSVYAQFIPQLQSETGAEVISMDVQSTDDISGHIDRLGDITNHRDEADQLEYEVQKMLGRSKGHDIVDGPDTLAIFGTPHAFYAFLPNSYLGDLIELSGGDLVTKDMQSHPIFAGLAPISMEAVIDRDPELLLVIFHGSEEVARSMLDRDPLWKDIKAVRTGNVAFLKDDLYAMRPGSDFERAHDEIEQIIHSALPSAP